MKSILIIYYSRTGNCEKIVSLLENELKEKKFSITTEKLIPEKTNYQKISGFINASLSALKREKPPLKLLNNNIEDFDTVIIISPVWANTVASPVRTFLDNYKNKLPHNSILVLTYQLFGADTAAKNAEIIKGSSFLKTFTIKLPTEINAKIQKITNGISEL
jgi:menaquinone-dependent protoporphyrinogen IX oxidase